MMTMQAIGRGAALAALVFVLVPAQPADAQGLGRLRNAVQNRVGNAVAADRAAADTAAQRGASEPGVTRAGLSAARLDQLQRGLDAEAQRLAGIAAELHALQPRADYAQCRDRFLMTPAASAAANAYAEAVTAHLSDPQNGAKKKAYEDQQRRYQDAERGACGPAPDAAEKLAAERQGAPEQAGVTASGLEPRVYAMLKEIVLPFCDAADRLPAGQDVKVAGKRGTSYRYTSEETALMRPRCAQLLPLLQATL